MEQSTISNGSDATSTDESASTTTHNRGKLDLRDCPEGTLRERLFGMLMESEVGGELDIVANRDIDPDLVRYQIEQSRDVN